MAEGTGLVPVDRELLIEDQQLAKQKAALRQIGRASTRLRQRQRLRFDPVDLPDDSIYLLFNGGRQRGRGALCLGPSGQSLTRDQSAAEDHGAESDDAKRWHSQGSM